MGLNEDAQIKLWVRNAMLGIDWNLLYRSWRYVLASRLHAIYIVSRTRCCSLVFCSNFFHGSCYGSHHWRDSHIILWRVHHGKSVKITNLCRLWMCTSFYSRSICRKFPYILCCNMALAFLWRLSSTTSDWNNAKYSEWIPKRISKFNCSNIIQPFRLFASTDMLWSNRRNGQRVMGNGHLALYVIRLCGLPHFRN